ncbi:hypothetical protein FRB99_003629 [Tulasnella sp. 403]|nr:hypothetical protein FRB99_003629 [Tulasnella sp. 403]
MSKEGSTPEQQEEYREALRQTLMTGYKILQDGGEAMDAAVAAVAFMEDCPLFNAGKGAVFNIEGKNELECSIMLSKPPDSHPEIPASRRGMALALLTHIRNPSKAVQALHLEPSRAPHATLSGPAAESIAESLGVDMVDPSYYFTEARWREHRRKLGLPETPFPDGRSSGGSSPIPDLDELSQGTVGAVCLDARGCISTVTSTGGKTNKLVGRLGDTPTFAAGYWAEEWTPRGGWLRTRWQQLTGRGHRAVGVSGTGDGDYFLRMASAYTVAARMKFKHESLEKASSRVVRELKANGGLGGLIAVDDRGHVAMPLNSSGMFRGQIREDGKPRVAIFRDEQLE